MNIVIQTLRAHIAESDVRFVFPSEIAASRWAGKVCVLGIARSVAANRFLAWDRFKEEVLRKEEAEREPVSLVMRKLFAESLIKKNARVVNAELKLSGGGISRQDAGDRGGEAAAGNADADSKGASSAPSPAFPLRALIPREYAQNGAVFVSFISKLLPSLGMWEKLMKDAARGAARNNTPDTAESSRPEDFRPPAPDDVSDNAPDAEDRDLELIKKEYAAFLDRHGLFEPSWEEIAVHSKDSRYVIFFPELIEDFAEYDPLLEPPRFIRVKAESALLSAKGERRLVFFRSAREEIRDTVTEIRRLHEEEGLPYEDMALSVPELDEMEPCLLKEFYLHHIPLARRAGKKLGETGAGKLFTLASECASRGFSFESLKALVLNDHIPWSEREKNKALVIFGIKNNCVSGYMENGKRLDIWIEAFKDVYGGDRELRTHYLDLKKRILALTDSKSFGDLRKNYFAFRGSFLNMNDKNISPEDDAVLSRCVEELGSLVELEKRFDEPELSPASHFAFFLSCLNEKEYVKADERTGVNIFRWRVAAAAPFACHFVLNASQSAASVLYAPMKFLRQDKRKRLGLEDRDATGAFFILCDTGEDEGFVSRTRISASAQTFSGWAIPHSHFARGNIAAPPPPEGNPYTAERRFWRELEKKSAPGGDGVPGLPELFPLQRNSYDFWKHALVQKENNFSLLKSPVPAGSPLRETLLNAVVGGKGLLAVTPTRDLNVYYECAQKWLYTRVFGAGEFSLEASLLDDISLGLLYHKILEKLFSKIKNEDRAFDAKRLDVYRRWTSEITEDAIKEHRAFKGPLALPLVSPQSAGMAKKISRLLELEAKHFDGYEVAALELRVSLNTGELLIEGVIDRVSRSPDGKPVIIDYKTRSLPAQSAAEDLDEDGLLEFQMPLYTKLYEESTRAGTENNSVQCASFYSIAERKIKKVMGDESSGRNKIPNREEYGVFLEAAETQIGEFSRKVMSLDFVPKRTRIGDCIGCPYKTACRTLYS